MQRRREPQFAQVRYIAAQGPDLSARDQVGGTLLDFAPPVRDQGRLITHGVYRPVIE